jgi:hypothetical protein
MEAKSRLDDALTADSTAAGAQGVFAKHCSPDGQSTRYVCSDKLVVSGAKLNAY